jgi:tetratricopeptide (TPR) repeat protein
LCLLLSGASLHAAGLEFYLLKGTCRQAVETFKLGEDLPARGRYHLALCYQELGERKVARLILETLLDGREKEAALLALAHSYLGDGEVEAAEPLFRRFLAEFPRSDSQPSAVMGLARVFARRGRPAEEAQLLLQLRRFYPFSPEAEEANRVLAAARGPFSLQVGSFTNLERAENLARLLYDRGYDGYLQRLAADSLSYRVRVGNFADQAAARTSGEKLRHELGLDYFVAHTP